jgi:hypothetical protein
MSTSHRFEVPPDPSLMEDIGATSFTVAEAIVELVANSIDARLEDGSRIRVDITVLPAEILVIDDASGMDLDTLAEAVRLGVKMDAIRGSRRPRKGMFGLGLKTAAASLGRYWSVTSRPAGGSREFFVEFDLSVYRDASGARDFDWAVQIEEREPDVQGPLRDRDHGTAVTIRNLRGRNPMAAPVRDALGSAYKPHIMAGDVITVNGDVASAPGFSFIEGTRKEIDITLGANDEYRITGWVALDTQTHNRGDYGFNLYRQGQLIEAWNKQWFPAHLMTSRIIGEANLDFVDVNFNKRGFQTQTPEWKLALETMREFLKPVVRASREVSRGRNDRGKYARAVEGLNAAMDKAPLLGDGLIADQREEMEAEASPDPNPIVMVQPKVLHLTDGAVHLSYVVEEFSSEQTPWDYLFDEHASELQAVLNANSRLYSLVKDEKFLGTLAIADCVTRFLVDKRSFSAAEAREIRDRWLYVALGDER